MGKVVWKKNPESFGKDKRKEVNGRLIKYLQLDLHIKTWFEKLRDSKAAISSVMILAEANPFITLNNLEGIDLSKGWLWKLLKRLNIVKRKATKIDQKSALLYQPEIQKFVTLMTEHRYNFLFIHLLIIIALMALIDLIKLLILMRCPYLLT